MVNRWIGILCVIFMLGANAVLITREFLPGWLAGEPPALDDAQGIRDRHIQVGIYGPLNELVGRNWTIYAYQPEELSVTSVTMLYPIPLPSEVSTPQIRVTTELTYKRATGELDKLTMVITGLPTTIRLAGEMYADQMPCTWTVGAGRSGVFVLDAEATRALGDALRPFARLSGLYVGRTWRLHLLDPLTQVLPGLSGRSFLTEPEIVRVTGTTMLKHRGSNLEVFIVEAPRVTAWVAPDGTVLRQEVDFPVLGKLIMRDEPFNARLHGDALNWRMLQDEDD